MGQSFLVWVDDVMISSKPNMWLFDSLSSDGLLRVDSKLLYALVASGC